MVSSEPVSTDSEGSSQQVSAEGIQQILAELQKLNRRMDTLNTRSLCCLS